MAEEKTFSAKQVATRIGTEAKTLRKFFRDDNSGYKAVGQGGRYDFPESELPKIKSAFDAWSKGKVKRNRPTNAERELAKKAGVIPGQRKENAEGEAAPRRRRNQPAPSPLDEDDLLTRCRESIAQRAARRGLTVKQGRWVEAPKPKRLLTVEEAEEKIPGFKATPEQIEKERQLAKDHFDRLLRETVEGTDDEEPDEEELEDLELEDEELAAMLEEDDE